MPNSDPTSATLPPRPDLRRRQEVPVGRRQRPLSNQLEYDRWAELLLKSNHNSFGRPETDPKFGPWTRRPLSRLSGSDVSRLHPPQQEATLEARPDNSRAHVIERYRQEMMDLVRNMSEKEGEEVPPYELSLRDIVESTLSKTPEPDVAVAVAAEEAAFEKKSKTRREAKGRNRGTGAFFLVKEVIPRVQAALGGRKRNAGAGGGKGAKVSPKPSNGDCQGRSCSSGSSNSSGGSRNSGTKASCYFFLRRDRSRSMEI